MPFCSHPIVFAMAGNFAVKALDIIKNMGMQRFLVQIIAEKFNTPKAVHMKSAVVCFDVLKHFCEKLLPL